MRKKDPDDSLKFWAEMSDKLADFCGDARLKKSAVSLKTRIEVDEKFESIKRFVRKTLDPGSYATIQIFKVFRDERPHGWKEIQQVAEVSKVTVNKKLKELTKGGVLKRYVIASFPPRTQYELNQKSLDLDVYKTLVHLGGVLYHSEKMVRDIIGYYIAMDKLGHFDPNLIEETIKLFLEDVLSSLNSDVHHPLSRMHESWHPLIATHRTYILMLVYWVLVEVSILNPKIEALTTKFLQVTSTALGKERERLTAHSKIP